MKINENPIEQGSYFIGSQLQSVLHPNDEKNGTGLIGMQSPFAKYNKDEQQAMIEEKREGARQKARKLVSDQFTKDQEAAADMEKMRTEKSAALELGDTAKEHLKDIKSMQQKLMDAAGITEDSDEYKDLMALETQMDVRTYYTLSLDERKAVDERVANMGPLTDTQKRLLALNTMEDEMNDVITKSENNTVALTQSLTSTKINSLKSSPMNDVQKQAAEIMDAASKDIIAMIMQEAKKHLDELEKEQQEKIEEKKEKEEEEEEKAEEVKEEQEASKEEVTEPVPEELIGELAKNNETIQKELQQIAEKNALLAEDLKGIDVDKLI